MDRLRRAARDDAAQSLVEFAIILPLILLIITGIFDVARAAWQENTLAYAAREATRYAIVHGSTSTSPIGPCTNCNNAVINTVVQDAAIGVYNITATLNYPDGDNDRNSRVSVDVTAPFTPLPSQYLLGGAFNITLRGGSMLVIHR
jgi:Flp pilus assembly protein TadG